MSRYPRTIQSDGASFELTRDARHRRTRGAAFRPLAAAARHAVHAARHHQRESAVRVGARNRRREHRQRARAARRRGRRLCRGRARCAFVLAARRRSARAGVADGARTGSRSRAGAGELPDRAVDGAREGHRADDVGSDAPRSRCSKIWASAWKRCCATTCATPTATSSTSSCSASTSLRIRRSSNCTDCRRRSRHRLKRRVVRG